MQPLGGIGRCRTSLLIVGLRPIPLLVQHANPDYPGCHTKREADTVPGTMSGTMYFVVVVGEESVSIRGKCLILACASGFYVDLPPRTSRVASHQPGCPRLRRAISLGKGILLAHTDKLVEL
jgi:hypothetical protein